MELTLFVPYVETCTLESVGLGACFFLEWYYLGATLSQPNCDIPESLQLNTQYREDRYFVQNVDI